MGKRVQKNSVLRDRNQAGCISGLISIFDFRLGRSSQKLLPDSRHESNRFSIGNGYPKKKFKLLANSEGARQGNNDGDENGTSKIDICRTSVKKLMEEEMFSQKLPKKKARTASVDFREPEYSHMDLVSLMEEFCNHVHRRLNKGDSSDGQESTSSTSNDHLDELDLQLVQKHTVLEEKLSEAAEAFLCQKFIDSGQMTDEAKIQQTKQFMDALDILNSNKELLLKLLEDSNSLLVKHIEDLRGSQSDKGETKKSVARTKAPEEEIDNSTECQELVVHKETPKQNMYKFFWRKVRSGNKNASKDLDSPRASSRIVVLKPNPAAIKTYAAAASLTSPRSSTQFLYSPVGNQEQGRGTLHSKFSLKEIKNKLKRVMGENKKEQHRISMDAVLHRIPNDNSADCSRELSGEISGREFHRKSSDGEKADKAANNDPSNDHEVTSERDASYKSVTTEGSEYAKEREADIYAEAKKHLSDMLSYREEDRNLSAITISKSLGKTLSLPEYASPPICSPRDTDHPFVAAQPRFSFSDNLRVVSEKVWQPLNPDLSATSSQNFETELHTDDDFQTDDDIQIQALDLNPDTSRECPETVFQESNSALEGDSTSEGAQTVETIEAKRKEESKSFDDPRETNSNMPADEKSSSTETNTTLEEEGSSGSLMDENRNNEPSMSSLVSNCLLDLKVESLESSGDGPAWESPVSVLEPFILDDASSPATPKSGPAELRLKPVRICFDEHDSTVVVVSPSDPELHSTACIEDRKPTFEYVRAVLRASGLSWDEFTNNYESASHLLDASLIDEVEVPSSRLCGEPELIFDCIDEVLVDLYERYFGCPPWLKFIKSDIRPIPVGNGIIQEVWEIIDNNFIPQPQPGTLDHIVGKDFSREGSWPNLRLDTEDIGIEISEAILIELMQDAVFDIRSLVELSS